MVYKFITLVGRSAMVQRACHEMVKYRHDCVMAGSCKTGEVDMFRKRDIPVSVLYTNPTTINDIIVPVVKLDIFDVVKTPKLIINCFPNTTMQNLIDLNNVVERQSAHLYETINLFVSNPVLPRSNQDDLMEKSYGRIHGVYCLMDDDEFKLEQLKTHMNHNKTRGI